MAAHQVSDVRRRRSAVRIAQGVAAPAPATRPLARRPARRPVRADIQGLRAVAVLVVVANHLFGWPVGGFVGVDIFFVVSGFLITGLLLREWEKHGRISFTAFYKRRIRRILPASVLVLVVTVIASFVVLGVNRAWSVLWDGLWTFFFAANWRFATSGTDYFQSDGPVSPLQHYWSLAVEEQFYFLWPWIILSALALFVGNRARSRPWRRSRRRRLSSARLAAGIVILALSAASFLWALVETAQAPTVAYFSTFSRAWELGLGALLAVVAPLLLRIPDRSRPVLAWTGLGGLVLSLVLVTESSAFPAPAALLPVLASGLIITAGTGGDQRHLAPLTNRVSGYIGDISFSLYLWHMPVVVLMGQFMPEPGPAGYLAQIVVMSLLSVASYHLWEDAIRKSPWLSEGKSWTGYRLPGWYRPAALATLASFVVIAVLTTAMVSAERARQQSEQAAFAQALQQQREQESSGQAEESPQRLEDMAPDQLRGALMAGPEAAAVGSAVEQALTLTDWGDSRPVVEGAIGNNTVPSPQVAACARAVTDRTDCYFGPEDAATDVVLTGDSVSIRWVAALLPVLEEYDWRLSVQGRLACSFNEVIKANFPSEEDRQDCKDHKAGVLEYLQAEEPDLVIISNVSYLLGGEGGVETTPARWQQGLTAYLEQIPEDTRVVVVTAPPGTLDMRECYTPLSSPADCTGDVGATWHATSQANRDAADATGAAFADISGLFCAAEKCPPAVAGVPVRTDRTHITQAYAEYLAPAFGEVVRAAVELRYGTAGPSAPSR